jgi:prophage antirepressor-like protein
VTNEIERFDFEGLDASAVGRDPKHGPIMHEAKFMAWLGFDISNKARIEERHLQEGDLVRGIFRPIGRENGRGRKADALTKRGVRRLLMRSNHPRAVEYADRVLDMLDELDRTGMVVDEARISDEQIEAGKARLSALAQRRLEERMDYQAILHSLKLGGAVADEYRMVQNTLYVRLFGATAARIRETRNQVNGERLKRGEGFTKASAGVAKNYLSESELKTLNSTVLATFAQIQLHHPHGADAGQMIAAINRAADLMDVREVRA